MKFQRKFYFRLSAPGYLTPLRTDIWHTSWWVGGAQWVRGSAPRRFFWMIFVDFLKKFLVVKDRNITNTEFPKTVPYVTTRPNNMRPSRREVKNDVWKYLQIFVVGMYAVCRHLLDYQDCTLSLYTKWSFEMQVSIPMAILSLSFPWTGCAKPLNTLCLK